MAAKPKILIYLLRRDLRLADNPVFNELGKLSSQSQKPFTHVLPIFVVPAVQVETAGFLSSPDQNSPYGEARSAVGGFWRCGQHRAKFLAESIWDLKTDLKTVGSELVIRVGTVRDVLRSVMEAYRARKDAEIYGLWMTSEEAWEEHVEERDARKLMNDEGKQFKIWTDEKYFIDDRDLPFRDAKELSDVFTTFRKTVEPLRAAPRKTLPRPSNLMPLPEFIPPQDAPFKIPDSLDGLIDAFTQPLRHKPDMSGGNEMPERATSAHPFVGGSKTGHERVRHLIESGSMSDYKDTRNGLLGLDFSTKLSAWLALGSVTARQVHWQMLDFEDGRSEVGKDARGYGKGENKGTAAVRFELLWRDYMRLCTRKFTQKLFYLSGYRQDDNAASKFISSPYTHSTDKKNRGGVNDDATKKVVERFLAGKTGIGLIDASQRELYLTGWTSNRARQNVASFLTKHLNIDWRLGAEWYESNLIDYDVSSNWGNWQYVAGVGNDPRGDARVFNPVKQAVDYDRNGEYVRTWVPELRDVGRNRPGEQQSSHSDSMEDLMGVFQAWRLSAEEKKRLGLEGVEWVEKPLKRIDFSVNRRGGGRPRGDGSRGGGGHGRGRGRGRARSGGEGERGSRWRE